MMDNRSMSSSDHPEHGPDEADGGSDHGDHPVEDLLDMEYDDLEPGVSADETATGRFRLLQIILGVLLIAAGVVMLVVPGPGLVAIMVGLNMIKPDNAIVRWMRRRIPGIPEEGAVPRRYLVLGAVFLIGGTVFGVLWGADVTNWLLDLVGLG